MFHEVGIEKNELVFLVQYKWIRNIARVFTQPCTINQMSLKKEKKESWKFSGMSLRKYPLQKRILLNFTNIFCTWSPHPSFESKVKPNNFR